MAEPDVRASSAPPPDWRERAIGRSVDAARLRAEQRVQGFLDAAFSLVDEKGSTEFTIQEVVERSKQSLRSFYEYFSGKDELVLAMFEETVREADDDIRAAVEAEDDPLERIHLFALRLHEWCDPAEAPRKRGSHHRRAISEFSMHLAGEHSARVRRALAPARRLLHGLIDDAAEAGAVRVDDSRLATALVLQQVMYSWFGNRFVANPARRITAEQTWEFCRRALGA